jgi:outer membrane protein assembly factor BamD
MVRQSLLLALIFTAATILGGCGLLPDQKDETKDWTAERFYSEASGALRDKNYQTAIKYYELLDARYPYGRYAMQGKLDLAYAYYKDEEPEAAIDALDRFIQLYPASPALAYAYYLRGIVNFHQTMGFVDRFVPTDTAQRDPGAATESFRDFMQVIEQYPDTAYARDARKRVIFLRNNLASSEVHIAQYYLDRGAYLAAAKRANNVVANYQRTPAVADALAIMADAYTQLGMTDLAADTKRVLALNLEQGTLVPETVDDVDESWLRQFWEFLELDEN